MKPRQDTVFARKPSLGFDPWYNLLLRHNCISIACIREWFYGVCYIVSVVSDYKRFTGFDKKDVIVLDRKTFDRSRVNINFTRFLQKSTEKLLECYLISRIVMTEKSLSPELIQRTRSNIFDNSLWYNWYFPGNMSIYYRKHYTQYQFDEL